MREYLIYIAASEADMICENIRPVDKNKTINYWNQLYKTTADSEASQLPVFENRIMYMIKLSVQC